MFSSSNFKSFFTDQRFPLYIKDNMYMCVLKQCLCVCSCICENREVSFQSSFSSLPSFVLWDLASAIRVSLEKALVSFM